MSRRILIVEDDEYIRETVGELLSNAGHSVHLAENGEDALRQLEAMTSLPDLIFLDLMMPIIDGFQFRAEQRADARIADIPVVVMSADPDLDSTHERLKARSYVKKPFDIDQILVLAEASA
jgi:CheY-like chemotaxis protein